MTTQMSNLAAKAVADLIRSAASAFAAMAPRFSLIDRVLSK
ncbi:MAG: hypothetical protein Q8K33_04110 [Cypionkella sp.]|jgi:hypothetical protein|nr:hypothetical protein [Cypionkella sp.]MDP2048059.1 hypothetical protein [Cypionkella sp.]